MAAIDLKAQRKDLYFPKAEVVVFVDVPEMRYLAVDGEGDPNTAAEYREGVEALYAVAYGVKFARKRAGAPDYTVMPLEGLWWLDGEPFTPGWKERLIWTLLIRLPDEVTAEQVEEVRRGVARKKGALPALGAPRLETLEEGRCAQIMHLGPYADEEPTGRRLHAAIAECGYTPRGKHHEVYIDDPRRTAPEKLRTVLRQPVVPR
jgi:hypothetical protein